MIVSDVMHNMLYLMYLKLVEWTKIIQCYFM